MQRKHFVHDPTLLVNTALQSISITNPAVALDEENRIVYRRDLTNTDTEFRKDKVALISGGGSGHEPGFAGFVGQGLLTASVAGSIFASPSTEQVRHALMNHIPTQGGVLVLVMNYTGDVLNFGIAVEKVRARGVDAQLVVVGDDVSVGRTQGGKVGRRGIAGSVLVTKIVGALAELGESLTRVYDVAKLTARNLVSIGSSLDHAHVPGRVVEQEAKATNDLATSERVEVGMGIHNEPGTCRIKLKAGLPELVKLMLAQLLDPNDADRHFVNIGPKDDVVMLVNNLGGVSEIELGAITTEVWKQLSRDYSLVPLRVYSGTFLSSLNGLGWSVSLLKVEDTGLGPGKTMLDLLDLPAEAVGWSHAIASSTWTKKYPSTTAFTSSASPASDVEQIPSTNLFIKTLTARSILEAGLSSAIASEPDITRFDTILGDGDCGISLKRTAEAVLGSLSTSTDDQVDAAHFINKIAGMVDTIMDGTSGAIYAIFLHALVTAVRSHSASQVTELDASLWAAVLREALVSLRKYTPASVGDRTLLDSLIPFIDTLSSTQNLQQAAQASRKGAEATKAMKPSLGRVVYVGGQADWMDKIPDPGAWGLAAFFDGMARKWSENEFLNQETLKTDQ